MAAQKQMAQAIGGFLPVSPSNSVSTLALSAAATWLAYSFVPDVNRQISKVKAFVSAVNGTLGANDLTCDLYSTSTSTGNPNASIESRNTVTTTPTGAAWVEFTGFTSTSNVTGGTPYWLVFKNANGTPGTNFPTYRFGGSDTGPRSGEGNANAYGFGKLHSTDSGGTWVTSAPTICGWRIEYADGTFQGIPISNIATTGTGDSVYSSRELGSQFVTPANGRLNLRGIALYQRSKAGSPTANLRGRLYTGSSPSLLATTAFTVPSALVGTAWFSLLFSAVQVIEPGTVLTVVMGEESNSDASGNRYTSSTYTIENDANSKDLMPWSGKKAYFDGSSWTITDTEIVPIGLILDTDGEFATSSGLARIIGG